MSKRAPQFVVNVQCALVRDGRYLMILRADEVGHAPGVLAFPGGKTELRDGPSEVLETTARREVLEETGVRAALDLAYVRSKMFAMTGGGLVVDVLFLGEYESGEPTIADTAEVADIQWMSAEATLSHPKAPPWLKEDIEQVESLRQLRDQQRPQIGADREVPDGNSRAQRRDPLYEGDDEASRLSTPIRLLGSEVWMSLASFGKGDETTQVRPAVGDLGEVGTAYLHLAFLEVLSA